MGTSSEAGDELELSRDTLLSLSNCTCLHLRKAARVITRFYDRALAPSGLKATQFTVLAAIAGEPGGLVTEVADWLGMDHSTMVRNLKPLSKRGLVTSKPGSDKRTRCLFLTEDGKEALREAIPRWQDAQNQILGEMDDDSWPNTRKALKAAQRAAELQLD